MTADGRFGETYECIRCGKQWGWLPTSLRQAAVVYRICAACDGVTHLNRGKEPR